jgi:hypothetical protein
MKSLIHRLPTWLLHWGIPLIGVLSILIASHMGETAEQDYIVSPFGFVENVPTIFLLIAIFYVIKIIRLPQINQRGALKYWLFVYMMACIYFAGEDQNWFQYWLGIEPPEYFLEHNKEHETNLHNMSTWFNQKPRILIELWAWVACILVPLGWNWPRKVTVKFVPDALWPDRRIVAAAALTMGIGILSRINDNSGGSIESHFPGVRLSELQEIFYAYLMVLYAAFMFYRLNSEKPKRSRKKA